MPRGIWDDDEVQFARLLAEINAIDLPQQVLEDLCERTNLEIHEVEELFQRADHRWSDFREGIRLNEGTPNSLIRHHEHGEDYDLVGEGAWIGIPNPEGERGLDVRLYVTEHGLGISVFNEFDEENPEHDVFDLALEDFVPWTPRHASPSS